MKRKDFIKLSSLALVGTTLPIPSCTPKKEAAAAVELPEPRMNWAGNYTYRAKNLHTPASVEEVQNLVRTLGKQKALGSRHCFNNIADSPDNQISTQNLNQVIELDQENLKLTVESGARYGEFSVDLHNQGYALHNLASLPHITAVGACATATHGSGVTNGNLATAVSAVELVTPQGELMTIDRNHPDFPAIVVGLGAFGIITKVTLDIQPTFDVSQRVFLDLPLSSLVDDFDAIMSAGYSVSLFTDWMDENISEVWVKSKEPVTTDLGTDFYGARAADRNIHPIVTLDAINCTEQMGVPGPWYDRLPHFKMGFTPSAGKELQSEFFVSRENAVDAILALEKKKDLINPQLMITEVRTIAADDFWMSPCYQQDSVAIHFTWKQNPKEVGELIPMIEQELAPFNVRPHWGKLFTLDSQTFVERYPKLRDFVDLARQYDPEGKFRNAYLDGAIFG